MLDTAESPKVTCLSCHAFLSSHQMKFLYAPSCSCYVPSLLHCLLCSISGPGNMGQVVPLHVSEVRKPGGSGGGGRDGGGSHARAEYCPSAGFFFLPFSVWDHVLWEYHAYIQGGSVGCLSFLETHSQTFTSVPFR